MHAHTAKQEAFDVIQRLPENTNIEEIKYRLYELENIHRGQQDAVEGKTQTTGRGTQGDSIMVKWTVHAKVQLRHIYDYIAQDSPLYARHVSEEIVQKAISLDELPRKG